MASILFEDTFELRELDLYPDPKNPESKIREKKFDKVSRLFALSESYSTELTLDFNIEIYPLRTSDKFELLLSSSLAVDAPSSTSAAAPDASTAAAAVASAGAGGNAGSYYPLQPVVEKSAGGGGRSLMDRYDYVMHGKVFKYAEEEDKAIVYVSYGGLLMALKGEPRTLPSHSFEVDSQMYLLMRKI